MRDGKQRRPGRLVFASGQRRGQMEIMGLAIIVILVSLGLLFAVQWMLKPPSKQAQRAKESVLAANFLNTMLGTTDLECNKRTVKELLQDCALTGGITQCPTGRHSCEEAKHIMDILFDNTLKKWNMKYHFSISGPGNAAMEQLKFQTTPCPGEREQKIHPLPVRPGFEISLALEICR